MVKKAELGKLVYHPGAKDLTQAGVHRFRSLHGAGFVDRAGTFPYLVDEPGVCKKRSNDKDYDEYVADG
ncbi:MAG: hypothetical protein EBU57_10950, partial [Alphaproteobacteria bacterium]|nr:hypothetical protein [Alphaproteobacteria bacterium]